MSIKRKYRKIGKQLVLIIALSLIIVELGLHILDPFGIFAKQYMWRQMTDHILEDSTGYAFENGVYSAHFTATILGDHSRLVPDSSWQNPCRIAFIGDSFTFGYGVDDNAVFVNLLADDLKLNARNYGQVAYNTQQVLLMRERVQADGYIYLHIHNDYAPPLIYHEGDRPVQYPMTAMNEYYQWSWQENKPISTSPFNGSYRKALRDLTSDPQVLIFAFNEAFGIRANRWYPNIILIDKATYIEHHVSMADWHPDKEGHRLIADVMEPYIKDFVARICE